jgi:parallel beta-helix repeat protein
VKKSASLLVLLLLASVVLVSFPQIEEVKAQSTIYIRADGSVEGTDEIQREGNVYTFLGNISIDVSGIDCIIVEKDNIFIDGAERFLQHLEEPTGRTSEAGILVERRHNVTITNITIQNFLNGIIVTDSSNITITKTTIIDNYDGIMLETSQNNSIVDNQIINNRGYPFSSGIKFSSSENNKIERNTIRENHYGIQSVYSSENIVTNNYIAKNDVGIYINYGGENQIFENTIIENGNWGIQLSSSNSSRNNNVFYHNNFINNHVSEGLQVANQWYFGPESNMWDNGEEGNYWSDYTLRYPNATEIDDSGIWNTPFIINEYNIDRYPIMEAIQVIPEFPSWIILPLFLTVTLIGILVRKRLVRTRNSAS